MSRFQFERDSFAFANELVWEYRLDPVTGEMTTRRNDPPPTYALRCFVMARSARQFFYHARFAAEQPVADAPTYRSLIREVVSRSPRQPCAEAERIIVPGYDGLRSFSRAQETLLKMECGGAWQSYCLRSHWRMVFPISRRHQAAMAGQLVAALEQRPAPIVHLVRFPQLTINHGIVLFGVEKTATGLCFAAYDPNSPQQASELAYHQADRTFYFARNRYWAGGKLDVIEVYRGWFY
ncbi:MAG: hypothetical protein HZA90_01480 [Verrucomicrobia bacterium]|nr:hypothetical protein [Verrucomicrobiota bacterium]